MQLHPAEMLTLLSRAYAGLPTLVSCTPRLVLASSPLERQRLVFQQNSVHRHLHRIELDPIKQTYSTAPLYPQCRDTPAGLVQPMVQGE
jgi:hypothetical protein